MIADALSRAPVFQPEEEEEETLKTAMHCLQVTETTKLTDIEEAIDKHYNANVLAIKSDANFKQLPGHHPARKLRGVYQTKLSRPYCAKNKVIFKKNIYNSKNLSYIELYLIISYKRS